MTGGELALAMLLSWVVGFVTGLIAMSSRRG